MARFIEHNDSVLRNLTKMEYFMTWGLEQLHDLLGNQTIAEAGNAAVEAGTEYAQENPWTALGVSLASAAVLGISTWYTCCKGRSKPAPTHQGGNDDAELKEGADNRKGKKKKR